MTTTPMSPHATHPDWLLVEPPPELWPMVVASTIGRTRIRRQVLRSLRVPLAIAAIGLMLLSSGTTVWVMKHLPVRLRTPSAGAHASNGPKAPRAPRAPSAPRP